jgi:hypothetical protein
MRVFESMDALNDRLRWVFPADDRRAAAKARYEIVSILSAIGATTSEAFDAEVAIGELMSNVTRHAGGFAEVALDHERRRPRRARSRSRTGLRILRPPPASSLCRIGPRSVHRFETCEILQRRAALRRRLARASRLTHRAYAYAHEQNPVFWTDRRKRRYVSRKWRSCPRAFAATSG